MSVARDFKRYRWFVTSGKTLVVGGKNAEQNDELLKRVIATKKSHYVMHTSAPGSPFTILLKERKKISEQELKECAIFTGCFSQAWKKSAKRAVIDIFTNDQLSKENGMKVGMWRVAGKVRRVNVPLELALTKQRGVLRVAPLESASKVWAKITPGSMDKQQAGAQLEVVLGKISHDELMGALPAGGITLKI